MMKKGPLLQSGLSSQTQKFFFIHNRFSVNGKQTWKNDKKIQLNFLFESDFGQFSIPQDIIETENSEHFLTDISLLLSAEFPFHPFSSLFLPSMFYSFFNRITSLSMGYILKRQTYRKGFRPEKERGVRKQNQKLRNQPNIKNSCGNNFRYQMGIIHKKNSLPFSTKVLLSSEVSFPTETNNE